MRLENVRVRQRRFDTEYKQRNYALHEIEFKHPWVYICDADVPRGAGNGRGDDARSSTRYRARCAPVAYRVRYKNMYLGKWIKHASSYPVWIIRLVRPECVSYEKGAKTNVHPVVEGAVGRLESHFIHYSFNSGLKHWLHKHNFYSSREAIEGIKVRHKGLSILRVPQQWRSHGARDAGQLKNLSYFLKERAACGEVFYMPTKVRRMPGRDGGIPLLPPHLNVRILDRAQNA